MIDARSMKRLSRNQAKAVATIRARTSRRFHQLRDLSSEGVSAEDAAKAVGMKVGSMRDLLYRETGSTTWPIKAVQS